jgi:hypothetical protein
MGRAYKHTPIYSLPLHWNSGGNVEGDLHNRLAFQIEEILSTGADFHWKAPVATIGDLPATLNFPGDARVVLDQEAIYIWDGVAWKKELPGPHKDSHLLGGADAFGPGDLLDGVVRRIRTTDGPTDLLVGNIQEGQALYRVGGAIIGITPEAFRTWSLSFGDNTGPGSDSASATPTVVRYKQFAGTTLWGDPIGINVVIGSSTDGRDVYAELYNETAGQVVATLTTTLTGQNIVSLAAASFTNPLPTGVALLSVRVYRGAQATTANIYDFVLY